MPSPFPGMDPYLERPGFWPDVHLELIRACRAALAPQVAPRYYVAVEQRTYIMAGDPDSYLGRPDVAAIDIVSEPEPVPYGVTATAVLERPITVRLPEPDEIRERYLEVCETETRDVITVIEILSPTNKLPGEGRRMYEKKRAQVLGSSTNLVEYDLLRAGKPMPMGSHPASHYRILVSREWERYRAQLYPFNLAEAIPEIPIPLRRGEEEPALLVGELLAKVYDEVRYDLRVDYGKEPDPPFAPGDAAWAYELLREAGRR